MVRCSVLLGQSALAAPGPQLLLQPGSFRSIKPRGQSLGVVDAALVSKPLIDLIDHRLKVERHVGVRFRQRDGNNGQRAAILRPPDPAKLLPRPGKQQRVRTVWPGIEHGHARAAAEQVDFDQAHIA